jgi:hypothetical protein
VRGVVTAEAGRLGSPPLLAIADATGGVAVKLPEGFAPPARGRVLLVRGRLAAPYGQLEVRPSTTDLAVEGSAALPEPFDLGATGPGEADEARLVRLTGVVVTRPTKATSGDISLTLERAGGSRVRIMADGSSGIRADSLALGATYELTGIAGQRASRKGALDGYRVWLRDLRDVRRTAPAPSTSTPKPGASATHSTGIPTMPIAAAMRETDRDVAIEATVTAGASLLDASGRRIVIQDRSGAVEVLIPADMTAPRVGTRIRAVGRSGTAYGAPRLRATRVTRLGTSTLPAPLRLNGPFTSAHTWRLVSITGRIGEVRKLDERWRAEILVGAHRLVVVGQPGARIPIERVIEGRSIEVIGVVRPAYPSASDRRATLLPRSSADVGIAAGPTAGTAPGASVGGATSALAAAGSDGPASVAQDVDLIDVAGASGRMIRVGGLVVDLRPDGFTLDDGSAIGRIVLAGEALGLLPLIEPGDALNVIGRVDAVDGAFVVVVEQVDAIVLGSDPGALAGASSPGARTADPLDASRITAGNAGLGTDPAGIPGAGAGLAGLLAVGVVSIAATAFRRWHSRRRTAVRVAARLSALTGLAPLGRHSRAPDSGSSPG